MPVWMVWWCVHEGGGHVGADAKDGHTPSSGGGFGKIVPESSGALRKVVYYPPLEKAVGQSFVSAQEIDRFVGFVTALGRAQRLR